MKRRLILALISAVFSLVVYLDKIAQSNSVTFISIFALGVLLQIWLMLYFFLFPLTIMMVSPKNRQNETYYDAHNPTRGIPEKLNRVSGVSESKQQDCESTRNQQNHNPANKSLQRDIHI